MTAKSETCENCRANYDCMTLHTIMSVLEKHRDEFHDARLLARYDAVQQRLAADGWAWPAGVKACSLGERIPEIRRLTDDLIAIWRADRDAGRFVPARNLYDDEMAFE